MLNGSAKAENAAENKGEARRHPVRSAHHTPIQIRLLSPVIIALRRYLLFMTRVLGRADLSGSADGYTLGYHEQAGAKGPSAWTCTIDSLSGA